MNVADLVDKETLIAGWVDKIKEDSLPAFSESVQELTNLADDDEAALEKLSTIIKRDAALSTKILRASNSVYRIRRGRINTVSRAIVMLGLKEVKKICLTCSLIDGLMDDEPSEEVKSEMSMAFYSATQARLFSIKRGDPYSEEVFLSALMLNIGPLALWKVARSEMLQVRKIVQIEQCPLEEAEEYIFGFNLAELSAALTKAWDLEEFIPIKENPTVNEKKRLEEITLATSLARTVQFGWDSDMVAKILLALETAISSSLDAIMAVLRDANREMIEMASFFGIHSHLQAMEGIPEAADDETKIQAIDLSDNIDVKDVEVRLAEAAGVGDESTDKKEKFKPIEPSLEFQMEALRNLSSLMMSKAKPTMYILHAMGGMHRGIGLDRVIFAMLNHSRTILSARLAVGYEADELKEEFVFDITTNIRTLFPHVFESNSALWLRQLPASERNELGSEIVSHRVKANDFFLSPVIVSGKWVGIFYADMSASERELNSQLFEAFEQFAMQATLAFQHFELSKQLASKRSGVDG